MTKIAKAAKTEKPVKTGETKVEEKGSEKGEAADAVHDTMQTLLDEANRMIKSMESQEVSQKKASASTPLDKDAKLIELQAQLEQMRKVSLRPFRISKMGTSSTKGLIDSGATHPLRGRKLGEKVENYQQVSVTLAGDQEVKMHLSPSGTILGAPGVEPIVPMGMLASVLGCRVNWSATGMEILHPDQGCLEVKIVEGCPMVDKEVALDLIDQMEKKVSVKLRALQVEGGCAEVDFIKNVVDSHPAFRDLPWDVKKALVDMPASDVRDLGNRRMRKVWKREGVMVHAFAGPNEGYTLRRAFHEVGGDKRKLIEMDILRDSDKHDLGVGGKAYSSLLRLALDGWVKGWLGGPPCRTRSVLRHREVEGLQLPRPVRGWDGAEHGFPWLSDLERKQVFEDDVLFMRFVLLYVISDMVAKVKKEEKTLLLIEQPAEPKLPEVVSWWRTKQWKNLEQAHGLRKQTFDQAEFGGNATKLTTVGGTIALHVPMNGRRGRPREVQGKTAAQLCQESRSLSRWVPGMMRAIMEMLERGFGGKVKMRAISWSEHVRMGHTPFRRDCRTCQMASARDFTHRRSKLPPKIGVLSLDTAGPFREGNDLNYANSGRWVRKARYLLVGAFTWFKNPKNPHESDEAPGDVPEEAPVIEEYEDEDQRQKALEEEQRGQEEGSDGYSPSLLPEDMEPQPQEEQEDQEVEEGLGGGGLVPQASEEEEGEKEDQQPEEERDFEVGVTRMCVPIRSRDKNVVLKAVIDFYLRLKADGYTVSQIHTDRGGEYTSDIMKEWTSQRDIVHTFTPGDSPQTNGRAEVAVQQIKNEIRRTLLGGGATYDRWPLAARFVNETHRLKQVGKTVNHPGFMEKVLIRKRYWHAEELAPTQEEATYLGPSWLNHGHYIERENGFQTLTRMVMHGLKEAPTDEHWVALEDQHAPMDDRRRIRGKTAAAFQCQVKEEGLTDPEGDRDEGGGGPEGWKPEDEEERDQRQEREQLQRTIAAEMSYLVDDHDSVVGPVYEAMAALRELQAKVQNEPELLQTKIVSQAEVRRTMEAWKPAIEAELKAMFQTKSALTTISPEEAKRLLQNEEAECLPSKMVYTLKPSDDHPQGKRKARLVVCGNFSEEATDQSDLFASGATSVAMRCSLALASQYGWHGKTTDIRTAFLNAPLHPEDVSTGEIEKVTKRALIRPPPLLVALGIVKPDEWWEALKAVYGYRKSPRLWSDHRDLTLRKIKVRTGKGVVVLQQMVSEPNIWRLVNHESEDLDGEGELVGLLLVYVDDLLLLSNTVVIDRTLDEIRRIWDLSDPEEINAEAGTRFLGSELWRFSSGEYMATQKGYTVDLLRRNLGPDQKSWKVKRTPLSREPDPPADGPVDRSLLRDAQRVMGEIVWLSTRCRPDLMLAVAKLSSLMSKDPGQVLKLVENIWHYLAGTTDYGLKFAVESDCQEMTIYTDSSFSDNCQGCVLVSWNGALLLWRSTRQSVVTVSTAESELVEVLEGACCGDATRVVLEEIRDQACRPVQHTDSSSALSIIVAESGSWRTRHLRKRAQALRSRVSSGDWVLRHMAGSTMPADIGTKVLAADRFEYLREELGMARLPPEPVKKEDGSGRPSSKEVVKTALKALVIAAKVAQVKGEKENSGSLYGEGPIQIYRVAFGENGLVKVRQVSTEEMGFWLVVTVVALILIGVGVCIGLAISGKPSLVRIQMGESLRRPEFLREAETTNSQASSSNMGTTQVPAPLPDEHLRRRSTYSLEETETAGCKKSHKV